MRCTDVSRLFDTIWFIVTVKSFNCKISNALELSSHRIRNWWNGTHTHSSTISNWLICTIQASTVPTIYNTINAFLCCNCYDMLSLQPNMCVLRFQLHMLGSSDTLKLAFKMLYHCMAFRHHLAFACDATDEGMMMHKIPT